jgi:hypothetical protein
MKLSEWAKSQGINYQTASRTIIVTPAQSAQGLTRGLCQGIVARPEKCRYAQTTFYGE